MLAGDYRTGRVPVWPPYVEHTPLQAHHAEAVHFLVNVVRRGHRPHAACAMHGQKERMWTAG